MFVHVCLTLSEIVLMGSNLRSASKLVPDGENIRWLPKGFLERKKNAEHHGDEYYVSITLSK